MRVPRALLVVLIAALLTAGTVLFAAPSSAGGPTSVLLVNPGTGRVAALYATDARYQRLSELLGASFGAPAAGGRSPGTGEGSSLVDSGGINVTWLIHDVQVWRVDRVYLDDHGVMVASQSDLSGGPVFDARPVSHWASNPRGLTALLKDLGLGAAGAPPPAVPYPADTAAPAAALEQVGAAAASTTSTGSASGGPWWALAGAAAGAVLVLGLGRLRSNGRRDWEDAADDADDLPSSADVISY
jgi:hypothetical protein